MALILWSSLIDLVVWSSDVIALDLDLGTFRSSVRPAQFACSDGNKTWSNVTSGQPVSCGSYSLVSYCLNFT